MPLRRALLWLFLMLMGLSTQAQIRVWGEVSYNAITPVIAANVTLEGSYDGATTDKKGRYSFTTTEPGNFTLLVEAPGFVSVRKAIDWSVSGWDSPCLFLDSSTTRPMTSRATSTCPAHL